MARRGKNEGSIYQRNDGRWAASVDLGFIDGKRERKTFYGTTRKAVAKKLADALGKQQRGALIGTDDQITVGIYLDRWLGAVSVRPKTKRQYEQVVRLYLKPALGPVRLTKLEPDQVRAMVISLEGRGLSKRTATLTRDVLRIALNQAMNDEVVARNVATLVRRPKPTRRISAVLNTEEARALLDALSGRRLETPITFGLALGLRVGEVLGLQWADLNLAAKRVTISHALQTIGKVRSLVDTKSKESRRTLALPAFVVKKLERHKVFQATRKLAAGKDWLQSDFVFTTRIGRPLDATLVTRDLKRILSNVWIAGRDGCKHERIKDGACLDCSARRLPIVPFHSLRHSFASILLASGAPLRDVSEALGHSDTRLTLDTYAHVLDGQREHVAALIDRAFGKA